MDVNLPKIWGCKHCDQICRSAKAFRIHCKSMCKKVQGTHIICPRCKRIFITTAIYHNHVLYNHYYDYKKLCMPNRRCKLCGKILSSLSSRNRHMKTCTGIQYHEKYIFPCACGKKFKSKTYLAIHQNHRCLYYHRLLKKSSRTRRVYSTEQIRPRR